MSIFYRDGESQEVERGQSLAPERWRDYARMTIIIKAETGLRTRGYSCKAIRQEPRDQMLR